MRVLITKEYWVCEKEGRKPCIFPDTSHGYQLMLEALNNGYAAIKQEFITKLDI